jgi:elongation factor G
MHGLAVEPKKNGDEQRSRRAAPAGGRGPLPVDRAPADHERDGAARASATCTCGQAGEDASTLQAGGGHAPPSIAYRETITRPAEGHCRHKKQTGGAGQFGEVFLKIEPLPRGAGFEFVDQVKGGTIPGQFIPAVEKGVRQAWTTARSPAIPTSRTCAVIRVLTARATRGFQGDRLRDRRRARRSPRCPFFSSGSRPSPPRTAS